MDNRTKNHQETEENMGPEIDRKRQKIERSSSDHKAIDSGEKMGPENTEDSDPIAKAKALVRKARESGEFHPVENIINQEKKAEAAMELQIERSMEYLTKNLHETEDIMGSEVDRKRQKIESSREEHKAFESREKMGPENTEDSNPIAKAKALVRKARESGACDYSSFPPDWLGINYSPMIACEGSKNYHFGLKIARYALGRIMDDVNDGKTFEVVRVDKIAILFYDHYLMQFTVREVVANADAPLKTILAHVYFPDYRYAEVCKWTWFHPSQCV